MNLFFWRRKKQDNNNLILRLHRGLQAVNKENTALHKEMSEKVKILEDQIRWLQEKLCDISFDRDEWQEKYVSLLESNKGECDG